MSELKEPDAPDLAIRPVDPIRANAPFRYRNYTLYWIERVLNTLAVQMQSVAIGWQIYNITNDPKDLGLVGLALFAPSLLLMLITGHAADRLDRRRILLACFALEFACCLVLAELSHSGITDIWPIYVILVLFGTARAFAAPATTALISALIPKEVMPSAIAWSSSGWQFATIIGPAIGGFIYAAGGPVGVYLAAAGLILAAMLTTWMIRARYVADTAPSTESAWTQAVAGLRFIRSRPGILGAISLDMVAVLCGGATALLPVFARDVLHTGPEGLGYLRAGPAVGALVVALLLAYRPLGRNAGRTMMLCVALFGIATIVFGLSESLLLSMVALVILGAADMISVNVRSSMILLGTPDGMRGRVSAANSVFIGASNELGELRAGFMAAWIGAIPAVVIGGVGTVVLTGIWAVLFPPLLKVDRLTDIKAE